jgi:signal transduction histidine kinase
MKAIENSLRQFSGPMGNQIHSYDWSKNSLGLIENWPISLCLYVQLILESKIPMMLFWGPENIIIPNQWAEPFHLINDEKIFPLGLKASQYFIDKWAVWEKRISSIYEKGEAFFDRDLPSLNRTLVGDNLRYRTLHGSVLKDETGKISGVLVLVVDNTEKITAYKVLEENEKRLHEALESIEMGTFEYRIESDEMIPSDRFVEITGGHPGMSRSEFVDQLLPEYTEIRNQAYEKALKTGLMMYQARFRKYPKQWIQVEGKIFFDNLGNPEKMVGTIVNITKKKMAEMDMIYSKARLEEELQAKTALEKQKDEFLQVASHELRTPLTSIRGYAQLVEEILVEKKLDIESRMMGKLNMKIDHLNNLVQNLFDVSRLSIGQLDFVQDTFELTELLKFVAEDFRFTGSNHIIIEDYAFKSKVVADRERISQVITNLLSNATKYSTPNTEIVIRTRREGNQMAVDIIDRGIGISRNDTEKIFDPFYRSDNAISPKYSGLGLGLYISSQIIEKQGGSILVNSTLGKGSTFTFTLPIYSKIDPLFT